jgi:hypothetical protein
MASSREAFSIGDIQCVAISDGTFSYPVEWILSNAPKEQLEDSLRNHDLPMNQVVTPYTHKTAEQFFWFVMPRRCPWPGMRFSVRKVISEPTV